MADSAKQYLEDIDQELQDLIHAGQKIQAIKFVRERMGCTLKEAKETIETLTEEMRGKFPDSFAKGGCLGMVLLVLLEPFSFCSAPRNHP
jgi:ribosomal protein L7/L12